MEGGREGWMDGGMDGGIERDIYIEAEGKKEREYVSVCAVYDSY